MAFERAGIRQESRKLGGGDEAGYAPVQTAVVELSNAGTAMGNWQNDTGKTVLVLGTQLRVTTASSVGGATADVGATATSATTSSDTLIDGGAIDAAAVLDNVKNAGTNGSSAQTVAAGKWITVTGSATPTAFVGQLIVQFQELDY